MTTENNGNGHPSSSPAPTLLTAEAGAAHEAELPVARFRRVLKGRYRWAVSLLAAGIIAGGSIGWFLTHPVYQGVGILQIHPVLPKVLYSTERSNVMPMFDGYIDSQAALLTSRRVVDMAMSSPDWTATGRGHSDPEIADFIKHLVVDRPQRSEIIQVSFTDPNPAVAMAAVKAVIAAFEKIYTESDATSQQELFHVLEDRRTALNNEISGVKERITAIAGDLGIEGLNRTHIFKVEELQRMELRLHDLEVQLAMQQGTVTNNTLSVEDLARQDATLAQLITQRTNIQLQIDMLKQRFGPDHPLVQNGLHQLNALNTQIDAEAGEARKRIVPGLKDASQASSVDTLKTQRDELRKLYDRLNDEVKELGNRRTQIESLTDELNTAQQRLDETRTRLEQLNVESMVSGRLSVISRGERPVAPFADKRLQHAVLGGGGLGFLGFGLVLLTGLLDRRMRYSVDASAGSRELQLLGILPQLPADLSDPIQAEIAASQVHHIRTLLLIQRADGRAQQIFSISGALPGAGKTSLALALGLSFAASGHRTLLIDTDFVGSGLTRRFGAASRRRMGRILVETGRIKPEALQLALESAQLTGRKLGEVLIERNLVTAADLEGCLELQRNESLGLVSALQGEPLDACITATGFSNLWLIPSGNAERGTGASVSPAAVAELFTKLRGRYDTIIVDTGPVLGCVESPVFNAGADATVLVVSRGEHRRQLDRIVKVLTDVRANVFGLVFNRAGIEDASRAIGSYSSSSRNKGSLRLGSETSVAKALIGDTGSVRRDGKH